MRPEEPTASGVSGDTYVYSGGLSASFRPFIPHLSIYIPASCFLTQQSEVLFIFSNHCLHHSLYRRKILIRASSHLPLCCTTPSPASCAVS